MRITLALAFLIICFLAVGNAYGEDEIYYCVDTDANGFYYEKKDGSYKRSGFNSRKFKIQLNITSKSIIMADEILGKTSYDCIQPFKNNVLSCFSDFFHFNYNIDSGRFVKFQGYGYAGGDHDDLVVKYGRCDKF